MNGTGSSSIMELELTCEMTRCDLGGWLKRPSLVAPSTICTEPWSSSIREPSCASKAASLAGDYAHVRACAQGRPFRCRNETWTACRKSLLEMVSRLFCCELPGWGDGSPR